MYLGNGSLEADVCDWHGSGRQHGDDDHQNVRPRRRTLTRKVQQDTQAVFVEDRHRQHATCEAGVEKWRWASAREREGKKSYNPQQVKQSHARFLLGLMDSRGTVTLAREISSWGVEAGPMLSAGASLLCCEFRRLAGSEENAKTGLGFATGFTFDMLWRSRRVGLDWGWSLSLQSTNEHLTSTI